ncbi:MAG: FAD-dependent oxidoreductase [Pseudomonadota bacterium]
MPFEHAPGATKRIAIIGGGISGLGAAYRLAPYHNVTLFEAEPRLGGHARTVTAGRNSNLPVDTGFLVFNYHNYPQMTQMFDHLDVPVIESDMSFGASINGGWLEYGLRGMPAVFAQKRNYARPQYLKMLRDILHFNKNAVAMANDPNITIGELLTQMGTGRWFRDYYLAPFTGAIWSTPTTGILDFPAQALITFMKNHALLSYEGQHQWYTVKGGSREYVSRMTTHLDKSGVDMRLFAPIDAIRRNPPGVEVKAQGGEWEQFDDVVMATHSDISLSLLSDAAPHERQALSAVGYQPNEMVLHADTGMMPNRRAAWSSWVYTEDANKRSDRIDLTYWINNLQPHLPRDDHCFVTLNTQRDIDPKLIYDTCTFHHPVFDLAALNAQKTITAFNGMNNTWFCGAWMRNGFHEDGFATALETADALLAKDHVLVAAE